MFNKICNEFVCKWSIDNGRKKSPTVQQPEARVARESFTNRHLHIGNIDIDFITFLCYQHFLQYFQGGKMNKNWNPIEMIKYFSPCQLWDCSGISQIGFTFSHICRCEDEDRNKCNREKTFTLFKRLRKHYFWPVGEERKYSTCLNNWSSVSSPTN